MKLRIFLLTIIFGLLTYPIMAQNNGCADYLKYYDAGDYESTISTILDCKSKNALSEQELDKAEFYLQISYGFTGDIDNLDIDVLERLCLSDKYNNTSSIIDAYLILSGIFYSKDNYENAISYGEKSIYFARQFLDINSLEYAEYLSFAASLYELLDNYNKAIEYGEQALKIYEATEGRNSLYYATSLNNLGSRYYELGDYSKAIDYNEQTLRISKSIFGEEHPDYATSLNNLESCYYKLGDYQKAIDYGEQALKIRKSVLGEEHPDYATSLNNLGDYYYKLGDYQKAIDYGEQTLRISKSTFGEEHPDYATSLYNLGYYYYELGDYQKAIDYGGQALKIRKSVLGEEHPDYATSLNNLGSCYYELGDYSKAIDYGEQTLRISKSIFGEEHPDYATSLNNLESCYYKLGDYQKAIDYGEQALKIRKSVLGEEHPDYGSSLESLGSYYYNFEFYEKAIEYGKQALNVKKSVLGENHLDYSVSLNNLGNYYCCLGFYEKAIEYGEQALSIRNTVLGQNNLYYARSLHNLGNYYSYFGDYNKAIDYVEQALKLHESILGRKDPEYALFLINLSLFYTSLGEYYMAIEYIEQALDIYESFFEVNHPFYSSALYYLGLNYIYIHDYESSSRLISKSIIVNIEKIKSDFSWLSEYERVIYWERSIYDFTNVPVFCHLSNSTAGFPELSYNSTLLSKGMLLQSSIELNKLLMESGDVEVINKAEDLRTLRATLNKLYEKPLAERHLNTDSLERVSSKLEKVLLSMSKEYGDYTRFMDVNWEDVQAKLTEKDVAIEIVEFPVFKSDSVMYAAMVLRKDWEQPQMIPLFEKKEIVSFMDQTPSKQYSGYVGKELYKLMWKPLESVVEEGNNVYFSPSGVYHQLAMEYLPTEEGTPLCDIYNMHRLSSTRQLVVENRDVAHKQAVLYGGIRYDVESDEMLAESKKYQQDESLYAHRGMAVDSLRGSQWVSLANTIPEVNFILGELEKHGIKSKVYSDTEANEESIKALSGKKVNILHLATHGFFLPIEETKKVEFYQMMGMDNNPAPDLSMRRSGLIMAGGNGVWTGKSIPEGVDDGVLTAQEISVLDFREMDMVVLSACETALGDIDTSEGVFGLQRAFKKAGVNTLLMSLWKVNDEVTKTLMNKFYQTLLSGKSKREAFLEAQRFVRNSHPDPKDWAAFVMVD